MGILDDAIKEHLELKRQHGADASELKQLEDEAFGAAERPGGEGSASEAPTEFMTQPEVEQAPETPAEEESGRPAPRAEVADLQEAPPAEPTPPTEEESPAAEHEIPSGPTTEERKAIAEQPTEMYDIEEELSGPQAEAPSEEELLEEEIEEPRLAPVDPLADLDEAEAGGEVDVREAGDADADAEEEFEEDDDFWDEKRLSDELDQALEAPAEEEEEGDPATQLHEDAAVEDDQAEEEPAEEPTPSHVEEDVLEETPDFLEETPEDDQLWFEQKPPKDFDFDD